MCRLSSTIGVKKSSSPQAGSIEGRPPAPHCPGRCGVRNGNECPGMKTMTVDLQLQRHGKGEIRGLGVHQTRRSTPTSPPRRPSCRRSDRRSGARWLNRDPIEEKGGHNMHGFLANRPISQVDVLGLIPPVDVPWWPPPQSPPSPDRQGTRPRNRLHQQSAGSG
jgi:hypothetical protein